MAVKGFTQTDKKTTPTKKKGSEIGKSGGPSGTLSGKAGGMRYGDTVNSVNSRATKTPWQPNPAGVSAGATSGSPYGGGAGYTPPATYNAPTGGQYSPSGNAGMVNPGGVSPMSTGGGTGSVAPTGGNGMDMGYSPMGFANTYYSGDDTVQASYAMNLLQGLGLTDNPAVASMVADAMNPALYAFMLQSGGQGDMSDAAVQEYVNQYLQGYLTPGGSMPDASALLSALMGADENSMLGAAMGYGSGTPEQQAEAANAYLMAAIYGMNPLAQQAFANASKANRMGYYADAMKDPTQMSNYGEYLANSPIARWTR